ncbi:DUF4180 domain-containing protein [Kitasatospora sp. LaBMicrA B282]|uniref:DUF4180 domain-containing protein n=1 Tax=Kitasatospora sp. LaBMicrA B282 TaxID=3420949 RepID=UPI003D0C072E
MPDSIEDFAGTPVLLCAADGAPVPDERAALDLIGDGFGRGARWVALPIDRLTEEFFRLRSGTAGAIVQKFATYRLGLAVLGDVSPHTDASTALRDFVRESNRGSQLWFLPDTTALRERLAEGN